MTRAARPRREWEQENRHFVPWSLSGALSFRVDKPVVPVGNQMERFFSLEIFRKKRNTFRAIPLFTLSPELWEYYCSICAGNSHRFSLQMESAPPVRFCLWKNCTVPFGRKFSPVCPYKWKALLRCFPLHQNFWKFRWNASVHLAIFRKKWSTSRGGPL